MHFWFCRVTGNYRTFRKHFIILHHAVRFFTLEFPAHRISLRGFTLLEDALAAAGHRVYFRSLYTQRHAIRTSLLPFFPRRWSSVEPSRLSAWIFHRECALPREGINLFCALTTVALFCRTRPGGRAKKVLLGVHSTPRVAANERCYTWRGHCNRRVTSEKTGRDRILLHPGVLCALHPLTRSKSRTLYPRGSIILAPLINPCQSKKVVEYLSIPCRFTYATTEISNIMTRGWLSLGSITSRK